MTDLDGAVDIVGITAESMKAKEQFHRYKFMRTNGHEDYVQQAKINEGFFTGRGQWDPADKKLLRSEGRPAETLNQVMAKIHNIVGHQIENRADVVYKPRDNNADPASALTMTKVSKQILQYNNYHTIETDMFEDGLIGSRGYLQMEVEFGTPGQPGDITMRKKHPYTILIDPYAMSYDPNEWSDWMEARWLSYNEIERIFGKAKAKRLEGKQIWRDDGDPVDTLGYESIRPEGFGQKTHRDWSFSTNAAMRNAPIILVLSREHKQPAIQEWFVDPRTGDTKLIPYSWDPERVEFIRKKFDLLVARMPSLRVRHTITADDVVLFDDWSIYRSFSIVPYFAIFRWGTTISWVENLRSPQMVLNKMISQQLAILNTTANGGWIIEEGSITNMTDDEIERFSARTGVVMKYAKGSEPPQKIKPNQLPQGHDRLAFVVNEAMKEISTVSDSQVGFDREDVAAKAIIAKQSRSNVNMNRVMANLDRTRGFVARKNIELVQDFYTEPRVLRIAGDREFAPSTAVEDVPINQPQGDGSILNDLSKGEYDFVVASVPASDTLLESEFEQALAMRKEGIAIPDQVLIKSSNLPSKDEIIEQMSADPLAQEREQTELRKTQSEVVETISSAKLKDAQAAKIAFEISQPELAKGTNGGPQKTALPGPTDNSNPLIKLAEAADSLQQKEIVETAKLKQQERMQKQKAASKPEEKPEPKKIGGK